MALVWTSSDGEESDGRNGGGIGQFGRGRDDRVGDEVIERLGSSPTISMRQTGDEYDEGNRPYRMLLLLDLQNSSINESPLDNISLGRDSLDSLAGLEPAPEVGEVLKLDKVPDIAEFGFDDGGFGDRGGGWNSGRHLEDCLMF